MWVFNRNLIAFSEGFRYLQQQLLDVIECRKKIQFTFRLIEKYNEK